MISNIPGKCSETCSRVKRTVTQFIMFLQVICSGQMFRPIVPVSRDVQVLVCSEPNIHPKIIKSLIKSLKILYFNPD